MKLGKRTFAIVVVLLLAGLGSWNSGYGQDTSEDLRIMLEQRDLQIKELSEMIEKLQERTAAVPGEAELRRQLDACTDLANKQKRLIAALEEKLADCDSKLKECKGT